MTRSPVPAALLVALCLTGTLTACGAASSSPRALANLHGDPAWGCRDRSAQVLDYAAGARGKPTRRGALAPYLGPGLHVVLRPREPHRNPAWLLVDDTNVIHIAVELARGEHGWLVSTVERCGW